MPITGSIKETGIKQTIANLTNIRNTVTNHTDFLEDVCVPELKKYFAACFKSGHGWRPLKRDTVLQKAKHGFPAKPLIRSGYYRDTAVKLQQLRIRTNKLEITCIVPYAVYLEYGTRNMPARQVFKPVADMMQSRIVRLYRIFYARKHR